MRARHTLPFISAFVLLRASVAAAAPSEEAAILDLERRACEAFRTNDVNAIRAVLAEGFTLTLSSGKVTTREDILAEAKAATTHYDVFQNHDQRVRLYADAAVVLGRTTLKGTDGKSSFAVEVQFTDTVVKVQGKWLLAAGHVSRLKVDGGR